MNFENLKDVNLQDAAKILQDGGLVAFPTETVYGLGADALNPVAAAKIYAAKGRPSDNPLIVHIADIETVFSLTDFDMLSSDMQEKARILMDAFWPGPLTIIFPKKAHVPDGTTGGLSTVAVRMPSHPLALELIRQSGMCIAAPSANLSGRPSPTTAKHVQEDMDGRIDMILDGGAVGIGIESTIVDLTGDIPTILRPGYITRTMLQELIGEVEIDRALIEADANLRPKAPGMKYTHYAPKGELSIVECKGESTDLFEQSQKVCEYINALVKEKQEQGFKVAVLAPKEHVSQYQCDYILPIGELAKGETIAANLYAILRQCDELEIAYMYTESYDNTNLGGAIMNRLLKAAGHRVISV
ncbi:MAG: L-threonylcarbamoyladenylate synthase [Wujia sp.]